jgi:hypothetical protein
MTDLERVIKKAKIGKASEETQIYLSGYFEKQSEIIWKDFLDLSPKGKTDKTFMLEVLALQALGKTVRDLHQNLLMSQVEGKMADDDIVEAMKEIENNNPQT